MTEIELPRTFEEFNDQRKASFIKVKNYKQAGGKLIGFLCSYTPLEVMDAAGAASVALCGMSDETIPAAETVLPANLCPLIKSTYGFALTDNCPFTYFSDMIVGETTCDGKKKMYELLNEIKKTYVLHLPQGQGRPYEADMWYEDVKLFRRHLEEFYGIEITDDDLRPRFVAATACAARLPACMTCNAPNRRRWVAWKYFPPFRPPRSASTSKTMPRKSRCSLKRGALRLSAGKAPSTRMRNASLLRVAPWAASSTRWAAPSSAAAA